MEELLTVRNLSRHYGDRPALTGLDLTLERGEVLGLLGPNGAGKTTCLQVLSGNLAPGAGEIRVMGVDLVRSPRRAKRLIGYLPERPPLYPDMRVDEYLSYCARLHHVPRDRNAEAVDQAKSRCGLEECGRRLIGTLSKGFRQRVGIAQAIVHDPDLVILDEPTEGLDPAQLREVRRLIRALAADCGVILSSHVLPEVQTVCTQVSILRGGRLLHHARLSRERGPSDVESYRIRLQGAPPVSDLSAVEGVGEVQVIDEGEVRIHLRPGTEPAALSRALIEAGWGLNEFTPERTDLERVFFDVVSGEPPA